ncbi:MAG: NrfD/PsrC family molybdoenzyme membrane anchor subunit [bacterium]
MGERYVEHYVTAHSALVEPHLTAWGWEIPVYLFLGGFTAGILVLSGAAILAGRASPRSARGLSLGSSAFFTLALGLISLGMGALFLDLEHKAYVWRLYTTFEPRSPMSWGAWILLLVYPVLALGAVLGAPREWLARVRPVARFADAVVENPAAMRAFATTAVLVGIGLGIYTGILLSSLGARPLWSSALLGPLFLASGLSSSAAFSHWVSPRADEREAMARIDNLFLAAELVLIALLLIGLASASAAHAAAAELVLGGPFTAIFWVGVVGLGIVVPLLIQSLAVSHRVAHTPIAPVLVMLGGLALRFVIVFAGQASHWPVG